ncbi:hypothetical protein PMIN06_012085 [Paraphaeosphaeria minitans]|uniref:Sister chromatid cohesion acetyltransferase Eco1 n=1 Tax=Paraphaeosphaeria minitans TaxID=565426 RepID=A0A9P6G9X7_9PLEO|nr:hypothetical protein PMIN01_10250 [Paraphaeosphaeria minitans]
MSTVRATKVIRTYSRQRKLSLYEEEPREPPAKRRRVESTAPGETNATDDAENAQVASIPRDSSSARDSSALPSSPKEAAAVFSDDAPRSSPPSSPTRPSSTPPMRKRRPMFSFVKRQTKPPALGEEPLSEKSHNVANPPRPAAKKQKKLVQMQLDLVAEPNKTCKLCGMEYVPSLAEDAALHRKFHAMNIGGVDISKAMSERLRQNQVWSGEERSFVAVVSRRDALALRNKAREVLKIVNTELGAVPIPDEALWSQTRKSILSTKLAAQGAQQAKQEHSDHSTSDRYKVYLYVQGSKCVGACLAERIQEAFPVEGDQLPADINSSSICVSEARKPAILGISRIWTSTSHRKHGVATTLLDSARSTLLYGMTIGKELVAFSQPTESGGKLARKWHGREAGWLVYVD